ncbi:hypothetical protein NA57DRAFT_56390 [Rhizodiscina lignyota]|uniref:Uncharacterized protein n=1 Tax=Rhizodiscina lignyota TaxID=1504668 RepID=A0A9P4IDB8_9PEZI|nr:hypothetical protein NA57DRAFT_56390 [Rhizodiscina lignyota]
MNHLSIFLLTIATTASALVVPHDSANTGNVEGHWFEYADSAATNDVSVIPRGVSPTIDGLVGILLSHQGYNNNIMFCVDPHYKNCAIMKPPKNKCINILPAKNDQMSSAMAFPGITCTLFQDINCSGRSIWFNLAYPSHDFSGPVNFDNKASSVSCISTPNGYTRYDPKAQARLPPPPTGLH